MSGRGQWKFVDARAFENAREPWGRVAVRNGASIAVGADFVGTMLETLAEGNEVVAIRQGSDGPDAAAVLCSRKPGVWTTFNPSETCIGLWIQAPDADPFALAGELMRALPGMPMAVGVLQLDPAFVPRPPDSPRGGTMDHFRTAWIPIAGSFDDYWAARGKNLRNNMKKARAELGRTGIVPVFEVVTDASRVESCVAAYAALETGGWKGRSGTALALDGPHGRFYRRLLEQACASGHGEVHRYSFGDRVVAMDLCLRDGGTLIVLKTAYDESHAKLSPASLMREDQLRHLFAEGATRRLEFYGPVMEWHTRWTEETRMLYHVNCYRLPVLSWVHRLSRSRREKARVRDRTAA